MPKLTTSKRLNYLLGEMGIFTPEQVLMHLPRRYDSYLVTPKEELLRCADKKRIVLFGKALPGIKTMRFKNLSKTMFYFHTAYGVDVQVIAWNRPYIAKSLEGGETYTLLTSYDEKNHAFQLLGLKKGEIKEDQALIPIYSLPSDYPDHSFRQLVAKSLKEMEGHIYDKIPYFFKKKYRFASRYEALKKCHFPASQEDLRQGLRVLKYEEALLFCLRNALIRKENKAVVKQDKKKIDRIFLGRYIASLPFPLTEDQKKVIDECLDDMDSPSLMYRLLQGDVGTGKTVVASVLMYASFLRYEQSAIMAPTDALARQHYKTLKAFFQDRLEVTLLVGSMKGKQRKEALEKIASGESNIIVGTHSLFSEDVHYPSLGLVIIDEQHKFGVNQRTLLANKGERADVLLMSATPIPRTLCLTIYGDLDVSTLTVFPSKKRDVTTKIVKPNKSLLKEVDASISAGKKVYVIAPHILGEEGTQSAKKIYDAYAAVYPGQVSLLHGKLSDEEKQEAMEKFVSGETPILVATMLVEVGIDVKEANLMIVYHPSEFGLSSLHQLRGRIGRDGSKSSFLMVDNGLDEEELAKLKVLCENDDGFAIAEEDLARRGPGTIAGTRQSGMPDLAFANLVEDFKMFEYARDDATYILAHADEKDFAYFIGEAKKRMANVSLA